MSAAMIPVGYMLKKVAQTPDWLKANVVDIYSVSDCVSKDFAYYIDYWQHNGYWLFNSPDILYALAKSENIDISQTKLFYYEAYGYQYDDETHTWQEFKPESSFATHVEIPQVRILEGYDVVCFYAQTSPEHSPISCNHLAEEIPVNQHCLLASFEEAKFYLESGVFHDSEYGPYRIFAVYSIP